jgi:hypothetical protein
LPPKKGKTKFIIQNKIGGGGIKIFNIKLAKMINFFRIYQKYLPMYETDPDFPTKLIFTPFSGLKKNIDEQPSRALIGSPEQVFQENLSFSSKGLLIQ